MAIHSVLVRCAESRVTLWVSENFEGALGNDPGLEIKTINPQEQIAALRDFSEMEKERLSTVFEIAGTWKEPFPSSAAFRSRSNLFRLLVLYNYGGVYLDVDTLVIRDFAPLLNHGAFLGYEKSIWRYSFSLLYKYIFGPILDAIRYANRKLPNGDLYHHQLSGLIPNALNNAVLGFEPQHSDLHMLLAEIAKMPYEYVKRTLVLGPYLLQRFENQLTTTKTFGFRTFYPLGPRISDHFFMEKTDPSKHVSRLISEDTYSVHWSSSGIKDLDYDAQLIDKLKDRQIFAYLVNKLLTEHPAWAE